MEMLTHQVVDVVAVRNLLVSAVLSVAMRGLVVSAVSGSTGGRACIQSVLVNVVPVHAMKVTVVKVVCVPAMANCAVPAIGAMLMFVIRMRGV